MHKPLKSTLDVPLGGDEITIDVTYRVIEQVERVFGTLADLVASETLVNNPRRHLVAEVIALWAAGRGYRRRQVIEEVSTCDHHTLQRYIGAIQGAVLFVLRHVDEKDMKRLAEGLDLEDEEEGEQDPEEKPKKGKEKPKASRRSATQ